MNSNVAMQVIACQNQTRHTGSDDLVLFLTDLKLFGNMLSAGIGLDIICNMSKREKKVYRVFLSF